MSEQTFKLEGLSVDQMNKILLGLSKLTFAEAFELVNIIQSQANTQLTEQRVTTSKVSVPKDSE